MRHFFLYLLLALLVKSAAKAQGTNFFSFKPSVTDEPTFLPSNIELSDTAIVFSHDRSMLRLKQHAILRLNNRKWSLEISQFLLPETDGGRIKHLRSRHYRVSQHSMDELLSIWTKSDFANLDADSLSRSWKDSVGGHAIRIMDGAGDRFEIAAGQKRLIYYVHEPEAHQEFVYVPQRQVFIDGKRAMLEVIQTSSGKLCFSLPPRFYTIRRMCFR